MGIISAEGIRIYAYHGCMEEEAKTGRAFIVDVSVETDLEKAAASDAIADTIDYVKLYEIVKSEMAVRSKLIEHAGQRIINSIRKKFPQAKGVRVKVSKLNPPVNGNLESVSVLMEG